MGLVTSSFKQWLPVQSLHFFLSSYACANLHLRFVGLHAYFFNVIICIYTAEPLCKYKPHVLFHNRNFGTLQGMIFWGGGLFSVMLYVQILVTLILQTRHKLPTFVTAEYYEGTFCPCPSLHWPFCNFIIILLTVFKQFFWLDYLLVCSCKICCLVCEP